MPDLRERWRTSFIEASAYDWAVEHERMKSRITQHDFEARTGGGIAGEGSVDFVAQVSKEHRCHYVILAVMLAKWPASRRE